MALKGEGTRTSLVLWAKALVASMVLAATAASVLMRVIIAFSPGDPTFNRFVPQRVSRQKSKIDAVARGLRGGHALCPLTDGSDQRRDPNAARSSAVKSSGCSHAAKWP